MRLQPWESDLEIKGGKPNKGTNADQRLKENKPDGDGKPTDGEAKPGKKPFPGAAAPFGKGGKKG